MFSIGGKPASRPQPTNKQQQRETKMTTKQNAPSFPHILTSVSVDRPSTVVYWLIRRGHVEETMQLTFQIALCARVNGHHQSEVEAVNVVCLSSVQLFTFGNERKGFFHFHNRTPSSKLNKDWYYTFIVSNHDDSMPLRCLGGSTGCWSSHYQKTSSKVICLYAVEQKLW